MLKITLKSPGKFSFDEVPDPVIEEGEALIEVKSIGICAGDISQYMGKKLDIWPLPSVQGHEFGGIVSEVKDSTGEIKVGDKVAVFPHIICGECQYCTSGLKITCENDRVYGISIDGGTVEKIAVPLQLVAKLSDDFDIRYSSIVEPAAVAYNLVKDYRDSIIMIIGVGAIGIMAVPIAKHFNNKVIAVDIDENHLNTARDLGADLILNFNDGDKNKKLEESFGKEKVEYIGITHINQQLLDWSVGLIRKCGTIAVVDIAADPLFQIDLRLFWRKIITLKGLDSMYIEDFKKTAELLEKGILDFEKITSKIFPMEKVKEAFDYKIENKALKVIMVP